MRRQVAARQPGRNRLNSATHPERVARRMRAPKVPGIPGAPRPAKHNQTNRNTKESRQREKLLDTSKANYFKYDLQDLLKASPVAPELHNSLIQTLWAKGTRDSTQEAKVWLND